MSENRILFHYTNIRSFNGFISYSQADFALLIDIISRSKPKLLLYVFFFICTGKIYTETLITQREKGLRNMFENLL